MLEDRELKPGKRYWWLTSNVGGRIVSGLFTGEYDQNNGNAFLLTRNGDKWSIPSKYLYAKQNDILVVKK